MAHKGTYKKGEMAQLKKKGVKPGTKKAHVAVSGFRKRKKVLTDGGYMLK